MKIEIEIPDKSDELTELQDVVKQVNVERGTLVEPITVTQYVNNIVMGYFTNRVLNNYKTFVSSQPVSVLKEMAATLSINKVKG
jgi:hypothetical protein